MIELCCEYLSVRCIWLYVLIMSRTCFRVNPHSIVAWMSRNSKQARNLKFKWLQLDFVYELRGCGFESSCSHLNFRFPACFEQGIPWHSDNYRVWIHSEAHTWHDKNIQSNFIDNELSNHDVEIPWNLEISNSHWQNNIITNIGSMECIAEGKSRKIDNSFVTDNRKARRKVRKQKQGQIRRKSLAEAVGNQDRTQDRTPPR